MKLLGVADKRYKPIYQSCSFAMYKKCNVLRFRVVFNDFGKSHSYGNVKVNTVVNNRDLHSCSNYCCNYSNITMSIEYGPSSTNTVELRLHIVQYSYI